MIALLRKKPPLLNYRAAIRLAAAIILSASLLPTAAQGSGFEPAKTARAGDIDPSFGNNGFVFTDVTGDDDEDPHIVIQPDGKIVLAGECGEPEVFCVIRYTVDGELDTTFNAPDGFRTEDITANSDVVHDLALQSDGDIVVVGDCGSPDEICVMVLNPDGSLDTSFNGTGILQYNYGGIDEAESVAIQKDDKILIAGECDSNEKFCIGRLTTAGALDTSFNSPNGFNSHDLTSGDDEDPEIVLQSNGKMILVGTCDSGEIICSVRFDSDGNLDTSWGGSGTVFTDISDGYDFPLQAVNAGKDHILVVGDCEYETYICLLKYRNNGDLDTSFGSPKGYVLTSAFDDWNGGRGLVVQPNGRILVSADCGFYELFCVVRYLANGRVDETFGDNGFVLTDLTSGPDESERIALQGTKIIVAGECKGDDVFCLVRYFGEDQSGVEWFNTGVSGGLYKSYGLYVDIPDGAIPPGIEANNNVCRLFIQEAGTGSNFGVSLDTAVYDIHIKCGTTIVSNLLIPITICIPPKADGITAGKQLFHQHTGGSGFTPLTLVDARAGYVCGQASQLSLFMLAGLILPDTGFAPGGEGGLLAQSASTAYQDTKLVLSIPKLDISLPIVGVPQTPLGWDVSWLSGEAGYLRGTAYPTLSGNTLLTAHVWDANNQPGPFHMLNELQYGDQFSIQAYGLTFTYEVRETRVVQPDDVRAFAHSDYDVVTLITCEVFNEKSGDYIFRRAVSAVLIDVQ